MTHDNIKGEKALEVINNTQTHLTSRNTFTMETLQLLTMIEEKMLQTQVFTLDGRLKTLS